MSRKSSKILPEEYKKRAIENGLSTQTVYARLSRGWELEKAVSCPPIHETYAQSAKRDEGWIVSSERPRLKTPYSTSIYEDNEELFNQAFAESGLSRSEFIAHAIEQYLTKLWKPQKMGTGNREQAGRKASAPTGNSQKL